MNRGGEASTPGSRHGHGPRRDDRRGDPGAGRLPAERRLRARRRLAGRLERRRRRAVAAGRRARRRPRGQGRAQAGEPRLHDPRHPQPRVLRGRPDLPGPGLRPIRDARAARVPEAARDHAGRRHGRHSIRLPDGETALARVSGGALPGQDERQPDRASSRAARAVPTGRQLPGRRRVARRRLGRRTGRRRRRAASRPRRRRTPASRSIGTLPPTTRASPPTRSTGGASRSRS